MTLTFGWPAPTVVLCGVTEGRNATHSTAKISRSTRRPVAEATGDTQRCHRHGLITHPQGVRITCLEGACAEIRRAATRNATADVHFPIIIEPNSPTWFRPCALALSLLKCPFSQPKKCNSVGVTSCQRCAFVLTISFCSQHGLASSLLSPC